MQMKVLPIKYLITIFCAFFALNTYAQTYFINENFATGSGQTPPTGWTNNTLTGNSSFDKWRFNNPGGRSINSPLSSPAAIFDSDNYSSGGGAEDVTLESPAVNTTGSSVIKIKWDQHFQTGFGGSATVEIFDGTTWNQVYFNNSTTSSNTLDIDVSTHAANKTGVKVRFRWRGNYSWWWIVDNVQLYQPSLTPQITTSPAQQRACDNTTAKFFVAATNTPTTFSWEVSTNNGSSWSAVSNGGAYSGATTDTLTITASTSLNNNLYRVTVQNIHGSNLSDTARLLVPFVTTPTTTHDTICTGDTAILTASVSGGFINWYDALTAGNKIGSGDTLRIPSVTSTDTLYAESTTGSGGDSLQTPFTSGNAQSGVMFDILTKNNPITINSFEANLDPTYFSGPGNFSVYYKTGTHAGFETNSGAWTLLASSTGITTLGAGVGVDLGFNLSLQLSPNTTYAFYIVCTNGPAIPYTTAGVFNALLASNNDLNIYVGKGVSGLFTATFSPRSANIEIGYSTLSCPNPTRVPAIVRLYNVPSVIGHPANSSICENTNTSFSVTATGTGLTYQWQVSTNGGSSWSNVTNTGIYSGATTTTLNLASATTAVNGYQYRCVASGTCTPAATSNAATLTINSAPAVTSQPGNSTICQGANTSFSVSATGGSLTYQWQVSTNNGVSWANLANGGIYSNVTAATLNLANAPASVHNYQYRCIVTGSCSPAATSAPATLFINTTPVVTAHPANQTICLGNNTSYTVAATSTATINYQWQGSENGTTWFNLINAGVYSGVNTATLNMTNVGIGGYSMFRCVVNSQGCTTTATSNSATLTIQVQPVISSNPGNQTICSAQNTYFAVTAAGTNITYQWQVSTNGGTSWANVANGGVYNGATSAQLTLTNVPATMNAYRYRCVVSGSCPTTKTSSSALLTVNTPVSLNTNTPTSLTFCSNSNFSLTVGATGTGISYRWYRNVNGVWTALTNGGIYSGVTTSTLNVTNITAPTTTLTFIYRCEITGTCNSVSSNTTTVTVHAKPNITANPQNATRCDSSTTLNFKVTATGTNLSYQWQLNTGSGWNNLVNNSTYSGATAPTLTLPLVLYSMNGYQYRCVVTGTCSPTATSGVATLTVNPLFTPSLTINATNDDICAGTSVTFTPSPVGGGTSPAYVWKRNNTTVGSGSTYTTTTLANGDHVYCELTSNATCATPKTVRSDNTIIMKVTPYATPTIAVTSDVGTSWCSGKPALFRANITNGGIAPSYEWQVNGQVVGSNIDTYLTSQLLNGDQVRCRLTSSLKCPSPAIVTSNTLTMTINQTTQSSIVIAPNPDSVICDNTEVTMYTYFTNGGTTPSFQWILNGQDIPGETAGTMKTTALNNGDTIQCRFISSATCVFPETSNPVVFSVSNPVDPSVNVTVIYLGDNTFRFTALPVNGGQNPAYQWYKNTVPIPGATAAFYDASDLLITDKIHVEMTSSEPCVRTNLETVQSRSITTGIITHGNAFAELGLYPNPNKGQFTIKATLNRPVVDKEVKVKITNSVGQTVFTQTYPTGGTNINLPVQLQYDLPNGMYQVNVAIDGNVTNLRFVLNR